MGHGTFKEHPHTKQRQNPQNKPPTPPEQSLTKPKEPCLENRTRGPPLSFAQNMHLIRLESSPVRKVITHLSLESSKGSEFGKARKVVNVRSEIRSGVSGVSQYRTKASSSQYSFLVVMPRARCTMAAVKTKRST